MSLDALRKHGLNVTRMAAGITGIDGLGVAYDPKQTGPRMRALEEAGVAMISVGEILTHEAFTYAQRLLYATERITVVNGIVRALEREPKNAAAAQWGILEDFPNRYLMGLGASAETKARGKGTVQFLRDYMTELDAHTERLTGRPGRFPRVIGGYSKGTMSLTVGTSDGLITGATDPEHTAWARSLIGPEPWLMVTVGITISDDPVRSRELRRGGALSYLLTRPHQIAKFKAMGFTDEDLAPPGSDRLIDRISPHGSLEHCVERLREHLTAGADTVNVRILGSTPNEEIDQLAEINQILNAAADATSAPST